MITAEFIPISSPQFVTFDGTPVDTGLLFPEDYEGRVDGAIVRLRFTATEEQARRIDHAQIRAALLAAGASRVSIEPQIVREARARSERISEQLSPAEALALFAEADGVAPVLAGRMVSTLREWSDA